jgi:8-oxo-dGTP diphosphatase
MTDRFRIIVDVHLVLLVGESVLLSRRHNTGFGDGCYHLPSGHLEPGESVVAGAVRETREETGVVIAERDMICLLTMHQRNPDGHTRMGLFFSPTRWEGEPRNCEPDKCSDLSFFPLHAPPVNLLEYPRAALAAIAAGDTFVTNGWERSDRMTGAQPAAGAFAARTAPEASRLPGS